MSGRPKPTQLKVIEGNRGRRTLPADEPKPRPANLRVPPDLSKAGRKHWRQVAKQLQTVGLLTELDRTALTLYCEAFARWVEANAKLQATGLLVKSPSGYPMQSPYLAIANKAFEQMLKVMSEFGMTPRGRVGLATPAKEDDDAFARLLD